MCRKAKARVEGIFVHRHWYWLHCSPFAGIGIERIGQLLKLACGSLLAESKMRAGRLCVVDQGSEQSEGLVPFGPFHSSKIYFVFCYLYVLVLFLWLFLVVIVVHPFSAGK